MSANLYIVQYTLCPPRTPHRPSRSSTVPYLALLRHAPLNAPRARSAVGARAPRIPSQLVGRAARAEPRGPRALLLLLLRLLLLLLLRLRLRLLLLLLRLRRAAAAARCLG